MGDKPTSRKSQICDVSRHVQAKEDGVGWKRDGIRLFGRRNREEEIEKKKKEAKEDKRVPTRKEKKSN